MVSYQQRGGGDEPGPDDEMSYEMLEAEAREVMILIFASSQSLNYAMFTNLRHFFPLYSLPKMPNHFPTKVRCETKISGNKVSDVEIQFQE